MEKFIQDITAAMAELSEEVRVFQGHCDALQDYQASLVTVCNTWVKWMETASDLRNPRLTESFDNSPVPK